MEHAEQFLGPVRLARRVTDVDSLHLLDSYASRMVEATGGMLAEGADALEVTQEVAHVNDVLTSRLLGLAEARLGPPPYAYAWLALGSHGRGEQVLSSDQDSALAYGGPRLGPGDPEEYFGRLATVVVDGLARAGIPRCTGNYMATSWRHPVETYTRYFERWVFEPTPADLLRAEIFLDVRPVNGSLDVSHLNDLLVRGGQRTGFQVQMARATATFRPPLVLLGRLHTDHGYLDVKRGGTAMIVLLARLYALAAGANARTTPERLRLAGAAGKLSASGVEQLVDAYRLLTALRLRHQVEQARRGLPLDNRIQVDRLPGADRGRLVEAVRTLRVMHSVTASRFQTHTVT